MRRIESALEAIIADFITVQLDDPDRGDPDRSVPISATSRGSVAAQAHGIARRLLDEAIGNGFEPARLRIRKPKQLGGGNMAMFVSEISGVLSFVLKLDKDDKLIAKAKVLRSFRSNEKLPESCRRRFPRVYAIKEDAPPFAYLMESFSPEDGFEGLDDLIFVSNPSVHDAALGQQAVRRVMAAVNALYEGYEASKDSRLKPSIEEDYLGRIKFRLKQAAHQDPLFQSRPVEINGTRFEPWQTYVDRIDAHKDRLGRLAPGFSCMVHGDSQPGNVRVKVDTDPEEIRFIDPKTWGQGDYLFDITKMTHCIESMGPVELLDNAASLDRAVVADGCTLIDYGIDRPAWIADTIAAIKARTAEFAKAQGDGRWRERYALGMAAILVGLPPRRIIQGNRDYAIMHYAEGMRWLREFTEELSRL